jgi:type I restriction enzyme, S subunit
MSNLKKTKISEFLFEREGKYKPADKKINGLGRIEKIDFSGNFHISKKPSQTNMILIKKGDLVISGINVAKGAMGIYSDNSDVVATIHYSSYTFDKTKINVDYFKRFLKSSEFTRLIKDQVKGGIKTEIKPKHILSLKIFLPDVDAQKHVVDRFERIEKEDLELKKQVQFQKNLLNDTRQRISQDAIMGRLTKSWRKNNCDENVLQLIDSIRDEKEELLKNKKIKKQKPVSPISPDKLPFDIPSNWIFCRLNDLLYENPKNGYSPKTVNYKTPIKTLKLGATSSGKFINTEIKYIDEEISKDSSLWLKNGDILIQRGNSLEFVGVSAIFNDQEDKYIYPDLMMKLVPVKSISVHYLYEVLMSSFTRQYFRDNSSGAQKTMPKINQAVVINALVPLCEPKEQKEIVNKINNLNSICNELESHINSSQTNAEKLMQVILDETFSQKDKVA